MKEQPLYCIKCKHWIGDCGGNSLYCLVNNRTLQAIQKEEDERIFDEINKSIKETYDNI